MLRTVCFKNFVKFKDYQCLDFHDDGPSILIGENGSGKSSVLEGIRRCLKTELSTSVSSTPDKDRLSYFICYFENSGTEKENVICGIVDIPDESRHENTDSEEDDGSEEQDFIPYLANLISDEEKVEECLDSTKDDSINVGSISECPTDAAHENANNTADGTSHENTYASQKDGAVEKSNGWTFWNFALRIWSCVCSFFNILKTEKTVKSYYKFAMKCSNPTPEKAQPLHVNLLRVTLTPNRESEVNFRNLNDIYDVEGKEFQLMQQNFKHAITSKSQSDTKSTSEKNVEKFLTVVFDKENIGKIKERHVKEKNECREVLKTLSNETVFTFPLRSIGPLQWSKSERNHPSKREENYKEAENRCEIIKCYLEDVTNGGQQKFDEAKEKEIFRIITQMRNYNFELKAGKISLPKGKYALLKTPEGILEAKALSILMSGKHYKTIILEEPDRGMHPQFIQRMIQVIKKDSNDKRVMLTTHNTTFITPWSLPDCFVFRHQDEEYCIISGRAIVGAPTESNIQMKRLRLLTSDHVSDILFAKKVIFFEGDSEMLFLTELINQILQGKLKDIEMFHGKEEEYKQLKENVSGLTLVKMNGKGNTNFCHSISEKLHLKHLILVDKDAVEKGEIESDRDELVKKRKRMLKEKGIFFWIDGDIEDMVIKISEQNDTLQNQLEDEHVTLNPETYGKPKQTREKLFLRETVTLENIRKCVKLIAENCRANDDLYQFVKYLEEGEFFNK